jgi:hypothetical protein
MGIKIKNTKFIVRNTKVRGGDISPAAPLGTIFRIVNTQTTTDSLTYTNINGQVTSSGNISVGGVKYILALYGSIAEVQLTGSANQLSTMDMLITTTINENPSFTEQLITATGTSTWSKPAGVTQVIVECWGGGGAGGAASSDGQAGSGGAGGGYARKLISYESAASSKAYTIGVGATGGAGNGPAGSDTTWETTMVVAKGGGGGLANDLNISFAGGVPGTENVGDITRIGGNGGGANTSRGGDSAGTGGLCRGSTDIPITSIITQYIEYGGVAVIGPNATSGQANGVTGNIYGGGGSGAYRTSTPTKTGGNGAQGLIRLIYR